MMGVARFADTSGIYPATNVRCAISRGVRRGESMSKCDWKISKTKRRMADRRSLWRLGIFSRLGAGLAVIAVAIVSLG